MNVYEAYDKRMRDLFGLRDSHAAECPLVVLNCRCPMHGRCLCQSALLDHRRVWLRDRRRYLTAEPYSLHARLDELATLAADLAAAGIALDVHWGQAYWSEGTTLLVARHPDAPRLQRRAAVSERDRRFLRQLGIAADARPDPLDE